MVSGVYEISHKRRVSNDEALEVLVTRFYKRGKLSLREGAATLGISKSEFIELLNEFEIPIEDNKPLNVGF
jgi:predicted HTH domain antitoxin